LLLSKLKKKVSCQWALVCKPVFPVLDQCWFFSPCITFPWAKRRIENFDTKSSHRRRQKISFFLLLHQRCRNAYRLKSIHQNFFKAYHSLLLQGKKMLLQEKKILSKYYYYYLLIKALKTGSSKKGGITVNRG
jgi:hypothetical protein